MNLRARVDEQPPDLRHVVRRRELQRGHTQVVLSVQRCLCFDHVFAGVGLEVLDRHVETRLTAAVGEANLLVVLGEKAKDIAIARHLAKVNRRPAEVVAAIEVVPLLASWRID
jgi:hypothetical protein